MIPILQEGESGLSSDIERLVLEVNRLGGTEESMEEMANHGVQVRKAVESDRDFILGLVADLLSFGPPPLWRDATQMEAVDRGVIDNAVCGRSPGSCVLIAQTPEGAPLGFIHLCEEQDYYGGPCGHIGDIVVSQSARGQGVGRALLLAAEDWARAAGYRLLTLNVFIDNQSAARLYAATGYKPEMTRYIKDLG
jgi:GNAT superfamily N-acetyltransferase